MNLRIYLRPRPNAKGECTIYFIIQDEWFSTGIKVHPDHWDHHNNIIKRSHPQYNSISSIFFLYYFRATQFLSNLQLGTSVLTKKQFETFVFNDPEEASNPLIKTLIDDYCIEVKLCHARIVHYRILEKTLQAKFKDIRIADINYNFALKLQQHLRSLGNNENTISRKMRMLKAIVHYAQRSGILQADPLINIRLKTITGTKKYLTAEELAKLEELHRTGVLKGLQQNILSYFLFSCYTALRFSDVEKLTYINIKNNCVQTVQEKTDKPVMVPLISKAKNLLQVRTTGRCFKVHSNQVTNKELKKIMKAAGIDKSISYHCSRHTFATLSIYWGMRKEIIADIMGIDFKTLDVYAKIVDDVKHQEMLKWEQSASAI